MTAKKIVRILPDGTVILAGEMRAVRAAAAVAKAVNYTPEQATKMVAEYKAGVTVESLATEMGRTVRSIVAKLSREKNADGSQVYVAKTYKTKTGETVIKKSELADKLTELADLTAEEADSLTKANKTALAKIVALLS